MLAYLIISAVLVVLLLAGTVVALVRPRAKGRKSSTDLEPGSVIAPSDTALIVATPADPSTLTEPYPDRSAGSTATDVDFVDVGSVDAGAVDAGPVNAVPVELVLDVPEATASRMQRLRARLARSESSLGRGLLAVLSRGSLDQDAWEEIEEVLLTADVGVAATTEIVDRLRLRTKVLGTASALELRALLAEELVVALRPELDRTLRTMSTDAAPAVLMVVGVNGTGKTTTCGKLARVLVADGRSVLLGAADTFRAAAADQLQTWGERVGAATVRGPEGGDPASVAFDSVKQGTAAGVDVVLIDTAGRLHNKVGLMDELGKVKRVVEKLTPIGETLLVLDATTGQNGLTQARVFTEVANVTGVVLTKLDGTAKGGIVISVQRELGVPVKLIGLGEGPDDLAPFDPEQFVDALLGPAVG